MSICLRIFTLATPAIIGLACHPVASEPPLPPPSVSAAPASSIKKGEATQLASATQAQAQLTTTSSTAPTSPPLTESKPPSPAPQPGRPKELDPEFIYCSDDSGERECTVTLPLLAADDSEVLVRVEHYEYGESAAYRQEVHRLNRFGDVLATWTLTDRNRRGENNLHPRVLELSLKQINSWIETCAPTRLHAQAHSDMGFPSDHPPTKLNKLTMRLMRAAVRFEDDQGRTRAWFTLPTVPLDPWCREAMPSTVPYSRPTNVMTAWETEHFVLLRHGFNGHHDLCMHEPVTVLLPLKK